MRKQVYALGKIEDRRWVNHFFENFLRRMLSYFFNLRTAFFRSHQNDAACRTVNNYTYIIFFLNVTAFFDQKAFNFFTFWSCLVSDKHFT